MNNQPNKNTEDEQPDDIYGQDNGSERDSIENDNHVDARDPLDTDNIDDTDKYLAIEQPGVSYTQDANPTLNSDHTDFGSESRTQEWNEEGGNSKNSDAFNQDDYILEDNIDLDEDQNQSISSDDEDFEESNERYTN